MRSRLHNESGFSLPELLIASTITLILLGGLATVFSIGLKTAKTSNSMIASQGAVQVVKNCLYSIC